MTMMHAAQVLPKQRSKLAVVLAVIVIFSVALIWYEPSLIALRRARYVVPASAERLTNATLGFGAIYVVSGYDSPRKQSILEAAAVTEINLTIPEQKQWTYDDIKAFRVPDEEQSQIKSGSIKAWLGHHVVLKEFLESGLETALILEDDVDWDIRLRTQQIPIAQRAARALLSPSGVDASRYPWARLDAWDILYIGHCGDYFGDVDKSIGVGHHHPQLLEEVKHILVQDDSMLWRTDLHPFTASLFTAFSIPEKTRFLHRSQWPLCTFGYAVTRAAAARIVNELAPAVESATHPVSAFDIAILEACRDGPITCYTLQPELFHHMEGESLIAVVEEGEREIYRPPVDRAGLEQAKYRGETSNIGCGFWSGDFYFEGNERKLERLRQRVGRTGRCLKQQPAA